MTGQSESCYYVFEVSLLDVALRAVLREVGDLPAHAYIEEKCNRIQTRIGSRVEIVDLIAVVET